VLLLLLLLLLGGSIWQFSGLHVYLLADGRVRRLRCCCAKRCSRGAENSANKK
jgi:hypothetical protein